MRNRSVIEKRSRWRAANGRRLVDCDVEILPGIKILKVEIDTAIVDDELVQAGLLTTLELESKHLVNEAITNALESAATRLRGLFRKWARVTGDGEQNE